ncbi:TetR family transcriptional regulator [Mycobacterium intracellulare subsp. chimaera]|nr:TetR family transcriptional regulator [Mycobacterium intracellulare subsp. chimaera]PBA61215.1 TetR family transcriptional regulator [Mycobacterium intracellulare subsp. chimaera]PBA61443.1 TetR family transcriptional regulator [Mycobacterium intracellulare subsp. chimaera]
MSTRADSFAESPLTRHPRARFPSREAHRLETRERVFNAAVRQFEQNGVNDTDVNAIVSDAGVARGTFYFHFPTKEHALAELTRREEAQIADELTEVLTSVADLRSALAEVIKGVVAEEERLGHLLFRDVLNLYFSATQPELSDSATHPIVLIVIEQIEMARHRGEVDGDVDAGTSAVFFLIGLYGLLVTNRDPSPGRAAVLDEYLAHFYRGLESR